MARPPRPRSARTGWLTSPRERPLPCTGEPPAILGSEVRRVVLDNGLRVLLKEVYPASVVSLGLWVGVGAVHEADEDAGVSHFLEHMLFRGGGGREGGRLARAIHELGGRVNGVTTFEGTAFQVVCPSRHFGPVLDLVTEALLRPAFAPADVEREARVILDELRSTLDRPEVRAQQELFRLAFPAHRYGRPVLGLEEVIRGLTAQRLAEHHRRYYRPSNLAVTVVGDTEAEQALERIARGPLAAPSSPVEVPRCPPEESQAVARRLDLAGDLSTAHLQIGFRLPSLFARDAFACDLAASILGEGRSSRLGRALRERRGLVNRVGCSAFLERDPGLLVVGASLPPEHLDEAEEGIFAEIDRLAREGVDRHELQKARTLAESSYVFGQETVEGQGWKLGYYEMLGDHALAEGYVRRLTAVTASEVREAAREHLRPSRSTVVRYLAPGGGR